MFLLPQASTNLGQPRFVEGTNQGLWKEEIDVSTPLVNQGLWKERYFYLISLPFLLINWTGWWHLTSVWMPRTWFETCHQRTIVAFQYKFLRPLPAVKHLAYVAFIKKFCWNFQRYICIISGSPCLKPHTSCIVELVPKPFFETDNSSTVKLV